MTNDELIAKIAEATGQKKIDIQKALEVMIETITQTVKKDGKVNVTGLGIFKLKDKKARVGRNPKTGETVQVPARKAPKFLPSKYFKETVN
jgi:DNA-binding protein HU-beta